MLMIVYQVISSNLCNIRLQSGKDLTTRSVGIEVGSKEQIKVPWQIQNREIEKEMLFLNLGHDMNKINMVNEHKLICKTE